MLRTVILGTYGNQITRGMGTFAICYPKLW